MSIGIDVSNIRHQTLFCKRIMPIKWANATHILFFGQQNQPDDEQVHLTDNHNDVIRQKQPEIDRICREKMQLIIFLNL